MDRTVEVSADVAGRMSADERREQLIETAIGLFAQKGFKGTTTKEIATAAGVTEALIFRHFPTKEALYEAILQSKARTIDAAAWMSEIERLAAEKDDFALFRCIVKCVLSCHLDDPLFMRLMLFSVLEGHDRARDFRDRQVGPVHAFVCGYIEARQREGALRDLHPGAVFRALIAMPFYHALMFNLFGPNELTLDDDRAIDAFTHILLDGLRRPSPADPAEEARTR